MRAHTCVLIHVPFPLLSSPCYTFHFPLSTSRFVPVQLRRWRQIDINITEAANEAKDNVKYLTTLDKFLEPLYTGTPNTIIDTLPALLNSVKMIHTIARYYNTTERMSNLFMKVRRGRRGRVAGRRRGEERAAGRRRGGEIDPHTTEPPVCVLYCMKACAPATCACVHTDCTV